MTRTRLALMPSGGLNALTALDTASMPVSEEPPFANARSRTKTIPKAIRPLCAGAWVYWPGTGYGYRPSVPTASRTSPTMIMTITMAENR